MTSSRDAGTTGTSTTPSGAEGGFCSAPPGAAGIRKKTLGILWRESCFPTESRRRATRVRTH